MKPGDLELAAIRAVLAKHAPELLAGCDTLTRERDAALATAREARVQRETSDRIAAEDRRNASGQQKRANALAEKLTAAEAERDALKAALGEANVARNDAVRGLLSTFDLHPHYPLRYRCNAGAVADAITAMRPDIGALFAEGEDAGDLLERFYPEDGGEAMGADPGASEVVDACPVCGEPWSEGLHKAFCMGPKP